MRVGGIIKRGNVLVLSCLATALPGCGTIGDTGAVKQANELAIACETDMALKALDRAEQGGGLSAYIADLQRVVILRDAGRTSEATSAMAARNARAGADAEAAAEAERAVAESLEDMRTERKKRSGRRVCP